MKWTRSVVTRLAVGFALGALGLSAGWGAFEYRRSTRLLEVTTSQQMLLGVHNLKDALQVVLPLGDAGPVESLLQIHADDPRILGVRLRGPEGSEQTAGHWPDDVSTASVWEVAEATEADASPFKLDVTTLMRATLVRDGRAHDMEVLIDGPSLRQKIRRQVIQQVSSMWIVFGALMLLGLLDLRRCLLGPMLRIRQLIQRDAPASVFHELGVSLDHDFGELAGSIGSMLGRLDEASFELRRREQALENMYQHAPAAMVSIGSDGRITHANRRAADLFETTDPTCLQGADLSRYVRKQDRGVLRQSIGCLGIDRVHRCEIRIEVNGRVRDLDVEFAAVHDDATTPGRVRLSMFDVTESKRLLRQVTDQQHLLDLVVNSMSDALVLVSVDGTVMTTNQRLGQLLHADAEDLEGRPFDPETFWAALQLQDPRGFSQRMAWTSAGAPGPLHEQYEGRYGTYLFHVIPICDEPEHVIARLWVVQDVTDQVQAKVLLDRQRAQLRTLHRLGQQVLSARSIDTFLHEAVTAMSGLLGIESLGVAVRHDDPQVRCKQLFWLGGGDCGVGAGQSLRKAIEKELLPSVLASRATTFWSDLTHSGAAVSSFAAAGLEAVAATPLYTSRRTQGVVWIARRGGQRIERDHLFLLEAMAPVLSASLENLHLRWEASVGSLRHPLTQLEAARQLDGIIAGQLTRPGQPWSVMVMAIDALDGIVEGYGLPAAEALLQSVAELLGDNCRACDRLVHDDQDRFVIVMPDTPRVKAIALAHRLKARVAAVKVNAGSTRPVGCTASFGLAGSPQDHDGDILTLQLARQRLSEAAAAGPGTVRPAGPATAESGEVAMAS